MSAETPASTPAGFDFGTALAVLRSGGRVARKGWNAWGMWLKLQVPDDQSKMTHPYLYIEYPEGHHAYPQGSRIPWFASQTDMLSSDWFELQAETAEEHGNQ